MLDRLSFYKNRLYLLSFCQLKTYLLNYPKFSKLIDSNNELLWKINNQKSQNDLIEIQENIRRIALRDWKLEQSHGDFKSALIREFSFMNRNEALIFMNICKEKCEQLNHHPNWTLSESKYGESLVSVILTTHDNNNNVSQKDFELASNLSYFYEERSSYYIYNRNIKNLVSMGFSVALAILFVSIFIHFYNRERNYNVRSKDFYLSKINH